MTATQAQTIATWESGLSSLVWKKIQFYIFLQRIGRVGFKIANQGKVTVPHEYIGVERTKLKVISQRCGAKLKVISQRCGAMRKSILLEAHERSQYY